MTFEPVLPPVVLAALAAVLLALRALSLWPAIKAGGWAPLRWTAMTLAMGLLLLAAARPAAGLRAEMRAPSSAQGGENVYLLVDRSPDSAIPDFGGRPRIAGIRDDIQAVLDAHPGARFAVISFSDRPALDWPLSGDAWSLRPVVAALEPIPGEAADQVNAAAAATVLRYQLISAAQQYPGSDSMVYYFGSGAPESTVPQGQFDVGQVPGGIDGGEVFGYGPDDVGQQRLRGIADQLGVGFDNRMPGQPLPAADAPAETAPAAGVAGERRDELYWVLTLVASALLLVEIAWSLRDLRRARSTAREVLT